jgi:hypothetical protein
MNRNIVLNIIYKEMYKNVNTKYEDMDIFCLNITKMSSCAETLDFKSNFSKIGVVQVKLSLTCTQIESCLNI